MRETANSCPAGAHGAEPAARRRQRHPVWLELPLRRRCASQRIRFFADERHTAINYNNHPGARLVAGHGVKIAIGTAAAAAAAARRRPNTPARRRGVNPRQRPGVSMFGISFVSDCALRRSPHRGGS
jgi:hypothetical protein